MARGEVTKTVEEFCRQTSCHGLHQVRTSRKFKAFTWLVCTALAALCCGYQLLDIINEVKRRQVDVKLQVHEVCRTFTCSLALRVMFRSFQIRESPIAFPAVTICNLNPFMKVRLHYIPELAALVSELYT